MLTSKYLVVSYSISTSNHNFNPCFLCTIPVVSYSISTSNHNLVCWFKKEAKVVSYSISTSNHNSNIARIESGNVVSYSISTSNHNWCRGGLCRQVLYLIPFLHQTTTPLGFCLDFWRLYLIPFLHQTTTNRRDIESIR